MSQSQGLRENKTFVGLPLPHAKNLAIDARKYGHQLLSGQSRFYANKYKNTHLIISLMKYNELLDETK